MERQVFGKIFSPFLRVFMKNSTSSHEVAHWEKKWTHFRMGPREKKVMNRPLKCERPSRCNYRVFVKCQDFGIIKLLWIGSGNYDG